MKSQGLEYSWSVQEMADGPGWLEAFSDREPEKVLEEWSDGLDSVW